MIYKLEIIGNKMAVTRQAGPYSSSSDWGVIVDNAYGLVAASGKAALSNTNQPFVWGEVLTINKFTNEFGLDALPTPPDVLPHQPNRGTCTRG